MTLTDSPVSIGPRQDVMARWRLRSRMIRGLRVVLPAALAMLTLGVVADSVWRQANLRTAAVQRASVAEKALNNRIVGQDVQGRRFEITASEVQRDGAEGGQVLMKEVTVLLHAGEHDEVRASARGGVYREQDGQVRLEGGVRLDDGKGNRFSADRSILDSKKGVIASAGGVTADGPAGAFTAGSYGGTRSDGTMVFNGGVRGRLNSR